MAALESDLPVGVKQLLAAVRMMSSGRSLRKARYQLSQRLIESGWSVDLFQTERKPDGTFSRRGHRSSLIVTYPHKFSIEIVKMRPSQWTLDMLNHPGHGVRVVVLFWGKNYQPWIDKRSQWRRVEMDELSRMDYLIEAGGGVIHTPQSLAKSFVEWQERQRQEEIEREQQRQQAQAELERKHQEAVEAERIELERVQQLVLEVTRQAWEAKEPLSCHGNVELHRHLPTVLKQSHGVDEQLCKRAVAHLLEAKKITRAKHNYTLLSGYKTTY